MTFYAVIPCSCVCKECDADRCYLFTYGPVFSLILASFSLVVCPSCYVSHVLFNLLLNLFSHFSLFLFYIFNFSCFLFVLSLFVVTKSLTFRFFFLCCSIIHLRLFFLCYLIHISLFSLLFIHLPFFLVISLIHTRFSSCYFTPPFSSFPCFISLIHFPCFALILFIHLPFFFMLLHLSIFFYAFSWAALTCKIFRSSFLSLLI